MLAALQSLFTTSNCKSDFTRLYVTSGSLDCMAQCPVKDKYAFVENLLVQMSVVQWTNFRPYFQVPLSPYCGPLHLAFGMTLREK